MVTGYCLGENPVKDTIYLQYMLQNLSIQSNYQIMEERLPNPIDLIFVSIVRALRIVDRTFSLTVN